MSTTQGNRRLTARRWLAARALPIALGLVSACAGPAQAVRAPADPDAPRIVSLSVVGSEILLGLGAEEGLVAVDRESNALPGLEQLPTVDLAGVADMSPDLFVLPEVRGEDAFLVLALMARGTAVVEVAPHDFDDAFELCRLLGERLGRADATRSFVRALSRGLVQISTASAGYVRPRVAAVVSLVPLEIAGGHSFTTDLIEIAGAESVTHGTSQLRIAVTREELRDLTPDLVVVVSREPLSEHERIRARAQLDEHRIAFLDFDPETLWLHGATEAASALRALVEPLARERAPRPLHPPNPDR